MYVCMYFVSHVVQKLMNSYSTTTMFGLTELKSVIASSKGLSLVRNMTVKAHPQTMAANIVKFASYNMHGINNGHSMLNHLCQQCDVIILIQDQERMETPFPGPPFLQFGVLRPQRAFYPWECTFPGRKVVPSECNFSIELVNLIWSI